MKTRDQVPDFVKGLLVVGMVLCHVYQFFVPLDLHQGANYVTWYVNAVTFSGFVACFGYTNNLIYYSKEWKGVRKKMLIGAGKMVLAFYISGIAFRVFVSNQPIKWEMISKIIRLRDIPGWSEFILSFAFLLLLGNVGFRFFVYMKEHKYLHLLLAILLLITTALPYERINENIVGVLIGTRSFAAFPILQYLPYYLLGMYVQEHGIGFRWKAFIVSLLASMYGFSYLLLHDGNLPERFPPSLEWILLPALAIYLYYLVARWISSLTPRGIAPILELGKNSMFYLLISNILIFAASGTKAFLPLSPIEGILVTGILFFAMTLLKSYVRK